MTVTAASTGAPAPPSTKRSRPTLKAAPQIQKAAPAGRSSRRAEKRRAETPPPPPPSAPAGSTAAGSRGVEPVLIATRVLREPVLADRASILAAQRSRLHTLEEMAEAAALHYLAEWIADQRQAVLSELRPQARQRRRRRKERAQASRKWGQQK